MPILGILASSKLIAAGDYQSIASLSGNGTSTTLTFSNIPSSFAHLQVRGIVRGVRAQDVETLFLRYNSDTAGNYMWHRIYGEGSVATASAPATGRTAAEIGQFPGANQATDIYGTFIVDILDYNNTNKYKTQRSLCGWDRNTTSTGSQFGAIFYYSDLWLNTNAVTSVSIVGNGAFNTGSRFALYGIRSA